MAAFCAVHSRDGKSFERYISHLTHFYSPTSKSIRRYPLLGLHLLNLLVTDRRAEFYTALARLGASARDPHIQFVVQLQQCILEGTFLKLRSARAAVPAPEYAWFVEALMDTVRLELASGIELAYPSLDLSSLAALLLLEPAQMPHLLQFAEKKGWIVEKSQLVTFPAYQLAHQGSGKAIFAPQNIMAQAVKYAISLDVVV